jgi:hypothetical protein
MEFISSGFIKISGILAKHYGNLSHCFHSLTQSFYDKVGVLMNGYFELIKP